MGLGGHLRKGSAGSPENYQLYLDVTSGFPTPGLSFPSVQWRRNWPGGSGGPWLGFCPRVSQVTAGHPPPESGGGGM